MPAAAAQTHDLPSMCSTETRQHQVPHHIPVWGVSPPLDPVLPQVLELQKLPSVVTLIGGGYIGMEFAGMFARLGCEVHVVARQALPLAPRFDTEVRLQAELPLKGSAKEQPGCVS